MVGYKCDLAEVKVRIYRVELNLLKFIHVNLVFTEADLFRFCIIARVIENTQHFLIVNQDQVPQ